MSVLSDRSLSPSWRFVRPPQPGAVQPSSGRLFVSHRRMLCVATDLRPVLVSAQPGAGSRATNEVW